MSSAQQQYGSETGALVAEASHGGVLNAKTLAKEIAGLTADQRAGVMSILAPKYLNPHQLGQLHVEVDTLLKAPQRRQDAADLAAVGYMRGADGKLYLTPARAKKACLDYHKMMKSNSQINDMVSFSTGGATVGALGWGALDKALGSAMGKSVLLVGAVASMTTQTMAHAPAPPGCNP